MTTAILSFRTPGEVQLICSDAGIDEWRSLEAAAPFEAWTDKYQRAVYHPAEEVQLLDLGCEIGSWFEGSQRWLTRLLADASAPLILEIQVSRGRENVDPLSPIERTALDAPWELIANAHVVGSTSRRAHLALDPAIKLSPMRRLGTAGPPRSLSRCRLSVLFMAAQPLDVTTLGFEREEAAISAEVGTLGPDVLDLFVEESGTLDGLAAAALGAAEHKVCRRRRKDDTRPGAVTTT